MSFVSSHRLAWRAAATVPVVVALGCLASCGTPTIGQGPLPARSAIRPASQPALRAAAMASAHVALCMRPAGVISLMVARSRFYLPDHQHFGFPAQIMVSGPVRAQTIASAVCALPPMPRGTQHCPGDNDVTYWLLFAVGGRHLPPVIAEPTGCQVVQGVGVARWILPVPGFWHLLGRAMGLTGPDTARFAGAS